MRQVAKPGGARAEPCLTAAAPRGRSRPAVCRCAATLRPKRVPQRSSRQAVRVVPCGPPFPEIG